MRYASPVRLRYIILCAAAFCPTLAPAAAWLRKTGETQILQTTTTLSSNHYTDWDGHKQKVPALTKMELSPLMEYGLFDHTTIGASMRMQRLEQSTPSGRQLTNSGIKEIAFFTRHRLWKNATTIVSIQPLVAVPGGYDGDRRPRLGTEQTTVEGRVLLGHNFSLAESLPAFVNAEAAYTYKSPIGSQQVALDVGVGVKPAPKHTVMYQVFNTFSLSETNAGIDLTNNEDYDLVTHQLSYAYEVTPKMTLQVGAYQHVYYRNTGDGEGVFVSIWYNF